MFHIFQEEKVITGFMLAFLAVSLFIRVLLGLLYQNMIRETDNMVATENKLLKQCKIKFANCYQLNNGVANIPVFVDKFLNRMSLGPLTFGTLYHLSGQAMLLSVVSAGIGVCKCIMDGRMLGEILPFYIVSFLGLYLYFSISTVVDIKGKKRILKVNLVDYLENHLSARISVTARDMEMLYGKQGRSRRNTKVSQNYGKRTIELVPINRTMSEAENESKNTRFKQEEAGVEVADDGRETVEEWTMSDRERDACRESQATESQVTAEELEALLKEFLMV